MSNLGLHIQQLLKTFESHFYTIFQYELIFIALKLVQAFHFRKILDKIANDLHKVPVNHH